MNPSVIRRVRACTLPLLALAILGLAWAHEWEELDPRAALADAETALTIAAAFLDDPDALAAPPQPLDLSGWPAELAWWTRLTARMEESGSAGRLRRIEIIGEVAPEWTGGQPADGGHHLRWREAMGELIAHAAARGLGDAAVTAAESDLADPDVSARDAELASWILLLPRLGDAEIRDLAPAFDRLDELMERGLP